MGSVMVVIFYPFVSYLTDFIEILKQIGIQ
jgi:hypothetical protein